MVGTLVEFRGWLRVDLNDPVGSGQRFLDGDLDRAVGRAVAELTLVWPKVTDTEVTQGVASRRVALPGGTFVGLMDVEEVEWPYGVGGVEARFPASMPPFRVAPDRTALVVLTEEVPAVGNVLRVRWTSAQVVTAGTTTVAGELDGVVALGAAGYASLAYSTPAADNFKYEDGATVAGVDDTQIPREWRERAAGYLARFGEALERLRRRRMAEGRSWVRWG